jgi:hypothetical protein
MNQTSEHCTSRKIAPVKIATHQKLSVIASAFGDCGSTGAKPPFPATASPADTSAARAMSARGRRTAAGILRGVDETARRTTRVQLPDFVGRPLEVYVNGVAQREGVDFDVRGRALVFRRELKQEGKLGFWRWTSIIFGVAGTYRQNDIVDVVYESGGRRSVVSGLPY